MLEHGFRKHAYNSRYIHVYIKCVYRVYVLYDMFCKQKSPLHAPLNKQQS